MTVETYPMPALASAAAVAAFSSSVATAPVAAFSTSVPAASRIPAFAWHALILFIEHGLVIVDRRLVIQFVADVQFARRPHQQCLRWQRFATHRFATRHIEQRDSRVELERLDFIDPAAIRPQIFLPPGR